MLNIEFYGVWCNEAGTPIGTAVGDYFEGTAGDLVRHLGAWDVAKILERSVRIGLGCGQNCLHREGCLIYRSYYPLQKGVRPDRVDGGVPTEH